MDTFSAALGGHGGTAGRARITVPPGPGRSEPATYTFTFDVPQLIANMERVAEEEAWEALQKDLKALPGKDVPGSWAAGQADRLFAEYRAKIAGGACAPGGDFFAEVFGRPGAERSLKEKMKSGVLTALAALRVEHPDATLATVMTLINGHPDQMVAVMDQVGKELPAMVEAWAKKVQAVAGEPSRPPS